MNDKGVRPRRKGKERHRASYQEDERHAGHHRDHRGRAQGREEALEAPGRLAHVNKGEPPGIGDMGSDRRGHGSRARKPEQTATLRLIRATGHVTGVPPLPGYRHASPQRSDIPEPLVLRPSEVIPASTTGSTTLHRRRPLGPLGHRTPNAGRRFAVTSGKDDRVLGQVGQGAVGVRVRCPSTASGGWGGWGAKRRGQVGAVRLLPRTTACEIK